MKSFLQNILLSFISVIVCLAIIEFSTRLFFKDTSTNWIEFRHSKPLPYENSSFYSQKFIEESFIQPGKWINPEGTRDIYPANYEGEYFHVKDHKRVTTNAPKQYVNKIHLFGGSTIYCSEVPDTFTVASVLQRLVNKNYPNKYKVINHGVTSINTNQQLAKLENSKVDSNDIVLFYGGFNDVLVFKTGNSKGWVMGDNLDQYGKMNIFQKIQYRIYMKFRKRSLFVALFLDPFTYKIPKHLENAENIESLKKEMSENYRVSIKSAQEICNLKKSKFYNFLQPCIFTKNKNSKYEKSLIENKYLIPEVDQLSIYYGYPALNNVHLALKESEINSYDLRSIFDSTSTELYLDIVHVAEQGNAIIAQEIFGRITKHKL